MAAEPDTGQAWAAGPALGSGIWIWSWSRSQCQGCRALLAATMSLFRLCTPHDPSEFPQLNNRPIFTYS